MSWPTSNSATPLYPPSEYDHVIPLGTGDRIAAGEEIAIMPAELVVHALDSALVAMLWRASTSLVRHALMALASLQLVLWALRRRDGLAAAQLPTELPFWIDRLITAAALSGGMLVLIHSAVSLANASSIASSKSSRSIGPR